MYIKNFVMSYDTYGELNCVAPSSMYSVLLENKLIPDPFYGLNDLELTKLADKDCKFASEFIVEESILNKEFVYLNFYGLDTICDIYLNGALLDSVKNMHRLYSYDVKNRLNIGTNKLELCFKSPTKYFKERNKKHFLYMNRDSIPGASHLRKALYMSGWDWSPALPDIGIFRPIELDAYDNDKIEDVYVKQHHFENLVNLEISVTTKHNKDNDIYVEIDNQKVKVVDGKATVEIKNPKLWWVRGYGEQNLYKLTTTICNGKDTVDTKEMKIGLRTLDVSTEKDDYGQEFCFVINGVKIFAMGANYVPEDNILSRLSVEKTRKLIEQCVDANFNCLRVWGGAYYPEDYFYDLCDEMGILVWQDVMVACANILLSTEFKHEMVEEVTYNIKRFRHHASLGLICGNNEMESAILYWKEAQKNNQLVRQDYLELYEHIIPEICEKYAPDVFYWKSSPSSGGGFDDPENESKGDVHYWSVWHSNKPFTDYRNHYFRFCSEFGFESFPSIKTVRTFCEDEDMNCFSRVMENHQKCQLGNTKILTYLASTYKYPTNFEDLIYASQLIQADALKYGIEHFRRHRGRCMGSIYWQLNDCWPVASWSSIDYYGRYKALHYYAKKFYAPVAVALFLDKDTITVNIANETMNDFYGKVKFCVCKSDFTVLSEKEIDVKTNSLSSLDVYKQDISTDDKYDTYVYADLFDKDGNFIMRQTELLVKPKHYSFIKPDIDFRIESDGNNKKLYVKSNTFTKSLFVDFKAFDIVLSDNCFDLTNNVEYCVKFNTEYSDQEIMENIVFKSVYDIR